jgi:RimJ/RimL family protein N-acetyltransferase
MELVKCIKEYWEFIRIIRTHPNNQKFFFTQVEITPEQQLKYMLKNADKYQVCLIDNEPVGYIGLIKENEITYCVAPNNHGKGIGTFMVSEFMKQYDTLIAYVFCDNIGSNKIFTKLGFQKQNFYIYKK